MDNKKPNEQDDKNKKNLKIDIDEDASIADQDNQA